MRSRITTQINQGMLMGPGRRAKGSDFWAKMGESGMIVRRNAVSH